LHLVGILFPHIRLLYTQFAQVYGRHLFSVRVTVFSSL